MKVLHLAISLSPSIGVVYQMEWEQLATKELGLDWTVNLITPKDIQSPIVIYSPKNSNLLLQYYTLRAFSYQWLKRKIHKYDLVLLRHSVHDPWEKALLDQFNNIITVHHTLEIYELSDHSILGNCRALLEQFIGTQSLQKAKGIVAVTKEIIDYEVQRLDQKKRYKPTFVYPNGIFLKRNYNLLIDWRTQKIELLFVASWFSRWHGLDLLIDTMQNNCEDCIVHIVGNVSKLLKLQGAKDDRLVFHGHLSSTEIFELSSRAWLGITSLALIRKNMYEACPLKTREYLYLGLPVYGNYIDSGLPQNFPFFFQGDACFSKIISFAHKMRDISKNEVRKASEPFISKTILLAKLNQSLEKYVDS